MTDKIQKFIDSLDAKTREHLKERVSDFKNNPFQKHQDIKKMKSWGEDIYRLRVGKIRIIFQVTDNKVKILAVDYRGNIY